MVHSLLTHNTDIQQSDSVSIVCMVTKNAISDYSRRLLLTSGFDQILEIEHIPNPNAPATVHVESWVAVGFTKLRIWSLTEYDQVLYIDADCAVVANISHLLLEPRYDCIQFAAAPDIFPPDRFNAGVLLIKPDLNVFHSLLREMGAIVSYDGGDTGFLNAFSMFKDWYHTPSSSEMMRLGFEYNAQRTMHWFTKKKPEYWSFIESSLRIVHYSSTPKPWSMKPSQRLVDRVEIMWHKAWISLNEAMNKTQNKKIELSAVNNVRHRQMIMNESKTADESPSYDFRAIVMEDEMQFDALMTRREIAFGRIYEGDDAVQFEQTFVSKCGARFNQFLTRLRDCKSISTTTQSTDHIFDGIPKILHQIWLGPDAIPQQYQVWSRTWTHNHPDWQYMLWTDATLKQRKFEWSSPINKSLFQIASNYGEKSDILRLEILYQLGGVYVDFDFECVQSLNVFDCASNENVSSNANNTPRVSCVLGLSNTGLLEVNNAWIACRAKHALLPQIWKSIQLICNASVDGDASSSATTTETTSTIVRTGPIQLTRSVLNAYDTYTDILILPVQCLYAFPNNMRFLPIADRVAYYDHSTLAIHHWGVSWNNALKNSVTINEEKNGNSEEQPNVNEPDDGSKTNELVDRIMNGSENLGLQSKIMSFLH
eukprot:CAMPEP_0202731248 /NCGR_PEP_ID=MMETSP1385-20130828/187053_1 /ASSEMBLY_ACC=CAM_ASM_000861 /TAXON_ID=933848 /ORGANISM="Elphidium margaritaceum" /LENGTH=652 /DNA_ID=CAMNT_0049397541 /DNA_START=1 /DNA_END=1959 /DNA_ORIENTATION=-